MNNGNNIKCPLVRNNVYVTIHTAREGIISKIKFKYEF